LKMASKRSFPTLSNDCNHQKKDCKKELINPDVQRCIPETNLIVNNSNVLDKDTNQCNRIEIKKIHDSVNIIAQDNGCIVQEKEIDYESDLSTSMTTPLDFRHDWLRQMEDEIVECFHNNKSNDLFSLLKQTMYDDDDTDV